MPASVEALGRPLAAAAAAGPLLRVEGVSKRFGATTALDGLSLDVMPGEFVALLGGSGSGKSTLLRIVAGFETADEGRVLLQGRDIAPLPPHARPVSMVFQSYALFPHLSVFDNVAYGLRRDGVAKPEIARRVAEALALVGLTGFERRKPAQLSGGQRQRVALVRSLVKRPPLLLLDEPLGALDAGLRERTGFELRALQRATGAGFVMVTHDQEEALALADRVAVLEQGRLAQYDTPQALYNRPATRSVAAFLGAANILEGRGRGDGAVECAAGCLLRPSAPAEGAVAYALRPERIRVVAAAPAENGATAVLKDLAFRGDWWMAVMALPGGGEWRVVLPADAPPPQPGEAVALAWSPDSLVPLAG
ncbi:ABC transporter ATP-binding protein [Paracraurococcus lichenis]|uniref:ABC transporter ATP-binding protein n=1 Tax=Paracraurococcus lichenis TaxID=3064888 RepID=A0ABT9DYN7_9PROT|nr:ABC transporter ATP-binding protein [Paracraurococcus sp. LOR1-02]MDO9709022.1 ABC transporter ATP-binding protein [Paracraurococcus sp. LOR1-02]